MGPTTTAFARRVVFGASLLGRTMATNTTCETRTIPFVLFGAGGVGAALLEAIVGARSLHAAQIRMLGSGRRDTQ